MRNSAVEAANRMVEYTVLLCVLAFARGSQIYLQQPSSSLMPRFPVVEALFKWVAVYRVPTYLGSYGCSSQKPIIVFTSEERAVCLKRKRAPGKESLVTRAADGSVTGKLGELKASQAYPKDFGQAVAKVGIRSLHSRTFDEVFGSW